jgi:protein arginine kinase activator
MKCQKCDKLATFHITELTGGKPQELHLCEEHARDYLSHSDEEPSSGASLAGVLAHQMAVGQTAEELAKLDQRTCPVCGISFYEFRNQGRLGCPHDYVCFAQELEPLLVNIHGETKHKGKRPPKYAGGTEVRTHLIRLRREMREAVTDEKYERAQEIKQDIKRVEQLPLIPAK